MSLKETSKYMSLIFVPIIRTEYICHKSRLCLDLWHFLIFENACKRRKYAKKGVKNHVEYGRGM